MTLDNLCALNEKDCIDIINSLSMNETKKLLIEATSEEQRDLYFKIYEFVLQKRQKEVLKEHVF